MWRISLKVDSSIKRWEGGSKNKLFSLLPDLTPFVTLSIFVAALLTILNISIFCTTVAHLRRRVESYYRSHAITLCSLYPTISCAALTTILFPKTWLACHTVMHLSFTVGAVAFWALCFRYVESEASYLKKHSGSAVSIRTPPCCCCCFCLPAMMPSKAKFCVLRYMIWQLPFVQSCIMLVLNVVYARDQVSSSDRNYAIKPNWLLKRVIHFYFVAGFIQKRFHILHTIYSEFDSNRCLGSKHHCTHCQLR